MRKIFVRILSALLGISVLCVMIPILICGDIMISRGSAFSGALVGIMFIYVAIKGDFP
jgi:uncharacterized membrane protein YjjP (DUF1212 family)